MQYLASAFSRGACAEEVPDGEHKKIIGSLRRCEFSLVMTKDYDTEKDNFYSKGIIVFNQYKTVKKYGRLSWPVPKGYSSHIEKVFEGQ
jgi:hypothetical protein